MQRAESLTLNNTHWSLKLFALLLPVLGLAFGLLICEIAYRAFAAFSSPPVKWSDRPQFYFAHELAPASQDYPHPKLKPANTFRIAVVGDSFTFAPFMQFTDAFPQKLETMLNLNDTELKAEVINYGVPAYSLSHEVAVVKKAIEEQADLIILQVTLNDPELKPIRPTGIQVNLTDPFGPYQPQGAWKSLFQYWQTGRLVAERLHNKRVNDKYRDYFLDLFENPKTWNRYKKSLTRVQEMSNEAKVPLVAFIFPLFGLPLDDEYPFWGIHNKVSEAMKELSIPHEDLQSIYAGIPLERLQVIPDGDRHPNEIAHRMAAEEMYRWLAEHKYLPEQLLIKLRYKSRHGIAHQPRFQD